MLTVANPLPVPEEVPLEHATIPTPASDKLDNKRTRAHNLLFIGSLGNATSALLKPPFGLFIPNQNRENRARPKKLSKSKRIKLHQQERWLTTEEDYISAPVHIGEKTTS